MATYSFYRVDASGRIDEPEDHECNTNSDAFKMARVISKGQDVEVWRGNVRIAFRKRDRLFAVAKRLMPRAPSSTD